jgi:hypothetical protein
MSSPEERAPRQEHMSKAISVRKLSEVQTELYLEPRQDAVEGEDFFICCFNGENAWYGGCDESGICIKIGDGCPA